MPADVADMDQPSQRVKTVLNALIFNILILALAFAFVSGAMYLQGHQSLSTSFGSAVGFLVLLAGLMSLLRGWLASLIDA